jgi:hypothetical protein
MFKMRFVIGHWSRIMHTKDFNSTIAIGLLWVAEWFRPLSTKTKQEQPGWKTILQPNVSLLRQIDLA